MVNIGESIVAIVTQAILGVAGWNIAKRAGYHPAWGLLLMIPIISYIAILYFAFTKWPIENKHINSQDKEQIE